MRIAVVGATGRTGMEVVSQGLSRREHVTAVVRRPDAITLRHQRLAIAQADVLAREQLVAALAGSDAVVSAVGAGTSRGPTVVYSEGIANVLGAMDAHGIGKLAVVSAAPVGPREGQPFLERRIAMPVLERLFGASYDDMRRMEALLRASDVAWISLRPPRLVKKPATGTYRVDASRPLPKARSITYPDLATALLDSLGREDLFGHAAFVAN